MPNEGLAGGHTHLPRRSFLQAVAASAIARSARVWSTAVHLILEVSR